MSGDDARRELAADAKALKDDLAFQAAILALRKQWFGELMGLTDLERIHALTFKLQALEAIPQQLQVFMNDQAMAERRKHHG